MPGMTNMATEAEPEFLENACIATRMLSRRRQLYELKETLVTLKKEFHAKISDYEQQEEQLRKKDLQFQESLVKFESFCKENESKQLRAAKRVLEERKLFENLSALYDEKKLELEEKKSENHRLAQLLEKNKKYHDYLTNAARHLHFGPNKVSRHEDILNRHKLLTQTKDRTKQRLEDVRREIAKLEAEIHPAVAKKSADTLAHCVEVSSLQQEIELKKNEKMHLRTLRDEQMRNMDNIASNLGQLYFTINNILERFETQIGIGNKADKTIIVGGTISSRHHGTTSKTTNGGDSRNDKSQDFPNALLAAMDCIGDYIEDCRSIVNEWETRSTEQS